MSSSSICDGSGRRRAIRRRLPTVLALSAAAACLAAFGSPDGVAGSHRSSVPPQALERSREVSAPGRVMPGQVLPTSAEIGPVPRQFAEGYAIYDKYGYARVGNQHVIVDPTDRRILVTLQ